MDTYQNIFHICTQTVCSKVDRCILYLAMSSVTTLRNLMTIRSALYLKSVKEVNDGKSTDVELKPLQQTCRDREYVMV